MAIKISQLDAKERKILNGSLNLHISEGYFDYIETEIALQTWLEQKIILESGKVYFKRGRGDRYPPFEISEEIVEELTQLFIERHQKRAKIIYWSPKTLRY